MNRAIISGNVGTNVRVTTLEDGTVIANFNVATNENYTDKVSGEAKTKTSWHRCVAWGETAEKVRDFVHKGSLVSIKGKISNREYDKTVDVPVSAKKSVPFTYKAYTTEVHVFEVMNLN
jgi:single-strand DNA-binding protein